jgi:serine/threonine protein kinase
MLSTDGVHEHLPDAEAAALIAAAPSLDAAAEALCTAALAAGSPDNLTVQLVRIESLPDGEIADLIGGEAALPPAPLLKPGSAFAGYAVLRELHSGSRSHVYLGRDLADGRLVALKVPATDHAQDPGQLQALQLEEWVMRRVQHHHLLKPAPQRGPRTHLFAASEYIAGRTLTQWMYDRPRPGLEEVRGLVRQVAAGLQALHRRQMLHRDLGPHNVLVDEDGTARIIDFGSVQVAGLDELAPRPDDGAFAGRLQYSAPELYLGHPASRQSDLYSLGVIAYQMLTGALPYGPRAAASRTRAALRRLRYVPARELNAAVPDWMDAALAKAVAIDPARRYEELSEFIADLATPNRRLTGFERGPLLQRGRLRLGQAIDALLALADRRRGAG